jgi:hypothetical protein
MDKPRDRRVHSIESASATVSATEMRDRRRTDKAGSPTVEFQEIQSSKLPQPEGTTETPKGGFVSRCMRLIGGSGEESVGSLKAQLAQVKTERDAAVAEAARWKRQAEDFKRALETERRSTNVEKREALRVISSGPDGAHSNATMAAEDSEEAIREQGMAVLFEGLEVISSDLFLADMVDRIVKMVIQVLNCEKCTLFLADVERQARHAKPWPWPAHSPMGLLAAPAP